MKDDVSNSETISKVIPYIKLYEPMTPCTGKIITCRMLGILHVTRE